MINVFAWLFFGLLVGFTVSRLSDRLMPGRVIINSVAGMLGATLAGVTFLIFDATPLNAISLWGLLVALLGALVVISLVRVIFRQLI